MKMPERVLLGVLILLTFLPIAHARALRTPANVPAEITFSSAKPYADPFNEVQLDVLFTDPKGGEKLVPAFWAGGNSWKVRYASPLTGKHRWRTQTKDASDKGLHDISGVIEIDRYRGNNPLFRHGPIEVAPDKRHFQHADGTPFFWLGDTWWMGLCKRLQWPAEFQELAANRKQKGFTVVQIVAGLYPDMHPFDERGANEAGVPWETNYARIRPEYFNAADERLRYLVDQGFTPCIVGAWGYFLPWMGEEKAKQHWRELVARYGAWPVVWCIAGEANLPWYLAKNFPYDDQEQVRGWTEVARYLRTADPFRRPTTIHPTGIGKLNARWAIDDASLIDFDMLQTPHAERDGIAPTLAAFSWAYNLEPAMPVVNGEPCYEMLNDRIAAQWPRTTFWLCMMNGAPGHTYGANGIWQVNQPGKPHGASPHGGNYGTIPWNEAMNLPGSQQIAHGKKFLQQFPWERCVPQSDTVAWDAAQLVRWGQWIWYPEGEPKTAAPVETRYFRRAFDVPSGQVTRAVLRFGADDRGTAWINGKRAGEVTGWQTSVECDITKLLRAGKNVIAIEAENLPAPVQANPASLIAAAEIQMEDGSSVKISSDAEWRISKSSSNGWQEAGFEDSKWTRAQVTAAYGEGPWGRIDDNPICAPFAIGIQDDLRIVYCSSPRALTVGKLRAGADYKATFFNPVTGETQKQTVTTDKNGTWKCPQPAYGNDWVVVLQRSSRR
jgi:hypothetical protein